MDCSKGSSTRTPKGSSAESLITSSDLLSRCVPDGAAGHRNRLAHPSISNFDCQKALLLTFYKPRNRLRLRDLASVVLPPFHRQTYYLTCCVRPVNPFHTTISTLVRATQPGPLRSGNHRCRAAHPAKGWRSYLAHCSDARPFSTTSRAFSRDALHPTSYTLKFAPHAP